MKVLFASDGSDCSDRAAQYLARNLSRQAKNLRVTLFNVDVPMLDRVAASLGEETVARIHRENSDEALKRARQRLKRAGVPFDEWFDVGNAAQCIARFAEKGGYDLVVMGSHGHGALGSWILGSVASRVLAESKVPVLIVR